MSKSAVPGNLSKYPTVTVARDEKSSKDTVSNPEGDAAKKRRKDIKIALSKSKVPTDLSKYPTVTVPAEGKKSFQSPDLSNGHPQQTTTAKGPAPRPSKPPTTTTAKNSGGDSINDTVQLKKGLKVALRKSNKALDITKYPKIVVTDDDSGEISFDSPRTQQESQGDKAVSQTSKSKTVSEAGNIANDTKSTETVHLKKGLKSGFKEI